MGRGTRQDGFGDWEVEQTLQRRPGFLEAIEREVDWSLFVAPLETLTKASDTGRPAYPALLLFKVLLLQQWYSLSDPAAEEALADRFSFRRFIGLGLSDPVPDESTICRFRNRMAAAQVMPVLLAELDRQLCAQGLVVKRGTLVDATLVRAQSRPARKDAPRQPKDQEAAWTIKDGRGVLGYKFHAAVDLDSGLIRRATLTKANLHEGKVLDALLCGDEASVFADCAYSSKAQRKALRARGIYPAILAKGYHQRRLTAEEQRRNALWRPIRSKVEKVFGTLKRSYQLRRARYLGLARNLNHALLQALAFNLKKLAKPLAVT